MKTNLSPVASSRVCSGLFRRTRGLRALALGAVAVLAPLVVVAPAIAGTPPGAPDHEADPVDLFLDQSRGDRATDEPRAGAFEIGLTGSLGLSSVAAPSFGVLAFVTVPFDRLHEGRRRELAQIVFAGGPAKLPPPDAGVPLADRSPKGRASSTRAMAATPAGHASSTSAQPATGATPAGRVGLSAARPASADRAELAEEGDEQDDVDDASTTDGAVPAAAPALTPDLARGAARAACKAAKLDEAEARLDALASRAKTSALLPELRLRATRAIDETESLTPTEYDPTRRTASGSTTTWLEARATFRLDRLVFADDEIAVERQRMARAAERSRLVERVLDLLDAWQRARASAAAPEAAPDALARAALAIAASEASLDVLTDGWFSRAIAPSNTGARDVDVAVAGPASVSAQGADRDAEGAPRAEPIVLAPAGSSTFSSPSRAPSAASPDARVAPAAAPRDAPHPSTSRAAAPRTLVEKPLK